jgi:hypothetical protein
MAYIDTVKEWFKTGLKPTQAQFWAKFAYLRWKDEKIPVEDIQEIEEILNAKADKEAFETHLSDPDAHADLFAKTRIIPYGEIQVFKTTPEGNQKEKEVGDYCVAWIENSLVSGNWNGGDEMLKSSYE